MFTVPTVHEEDDYMEIYHYATVAAEPAEGIEGVSVRWVIGKNVGAPNFAMRVFDVQPSASTPLHSHDWEHEVFVLDGQGLAVNEQRESPISRDSVVFVPPDEQHCFKNNGDEILRFICVIPY